MLSKGVSRNCQKMTIEPLRLKSSRIFGVKIFRFWVRRCDGSIASHAIVVK